MIASFLGHVEGRGVGCRTWVTNGIFIKDNHALRHADGLVVFLDYVLEHSLLEVEVACDGQVTRYAGVGCYIETDVGYIVIDVGVSSWKCLYMFGVN